MDIEAFFHELSALFASGDLGAVSGFLKRELSRARMLGDSHAAVTVLNEMIGYFRSISEHREALNASEQALAEMRRLGYEDSPDFGTTLLNAATAYRAAGEKERALALYEQALALYQKRLAPDDPRLAGLYNNLSALHMESEAYETAAAMLRQSARIMTAANNAGPDSELDAATVYSNLALALSRSGDEKGADAALGSALAIFERHDDAARKPPHYAAALSALAETWFKQGRHADAAALYERALRHIEACYGKNRDYAVTAANCARVFAAMREDEKAKRYERLGHEAAARHKK